MNIIKTVGDLQKALSAYDSNLPFDFSVDNKSLVNAINNDGSIYMTFGDDDKSFKLHIELNSQGD